MQVKVEHRLVELGQTQRPCELVPRSRETTTLDIAGGKGADGGKTRGRVNEP